MNRIGVSFLMAVAAVSFAVLCSTTDAQFVNRRAARWYGGAAVYGAGINYGLGYGGYGGYGGTTAAGNYQQGMADVIRAQGEATESAARAAKDREVARSRYIDNQTKWLEEYNHRKRIGTAKREEENAKRRASIDRYRSSRDSRSSEMPAATQLDPDTGDIIWPDVLQQQEYQSGRERLDELFQARKESGSSPAAADEVRELVNQMQRTLKTHIRDYSPNDFIAADKFLSALAKAGSTAA